MHHAPAFWLKEKLLYDLPDVTFQNRMVVLLEGRTTSSQPFQYLWTTSPTLNDLINSDNYVVPTVKVCSVVAFDVAVVVLFSL